MEEKKEECMVVEIDRQKGRLGVVGSGGHVEVDAYIGIE